MNSTALIPLALVFYSCGLFAHLGGRGFTLPWGCMAAGTLINGLAVGIRCWQAWPMLPMHLMPTALPFCLGCLWLCCSYRSNSTVERREGVLLQFLIIGLLLAALIFPKDFYLPFLRSKTIWAHLFLLFGILARGLLLMASIKALVSLMEWRKKGIRPSPPATGWSIWGFGCLTLSLFCGEMWSYLGWGTPVVWEDSSITTILALWFYWTCLLHLNYTATWSRPRQALLTVMGGVLIILACHPDLGPLRLPHLS